MPVDANMLVALMAPRPVLLQTGDTDLLVGPQRRVFWLPWPPRIPAAREAGPENEPDAPGRTAIFHNIGYLSTPAGMVRLLPSDWDQYLKFLQMHLQR